MSEYKPEDPKPFVPGEPVVTHKFNKEPVTPLYLVYFRTQRGVPTAQLWYGDYDADYNESGGFLAATKHLRYPNGKFKVEWEHRFVGIENLMQLYPFKEPTDA
jgi:hypothetical protein